MPLWGTTATAATNKPKWLPNDANSPYDKTKVYATQSGWVQRAGTAATGCGNTSATPEVLVAIGGLAGATASTGLKHPTMTNHRVVTSADHGTSNNIVFEITYDEKVTYTAGTAATLVLTAGSGTNATATLTHIDGTSLANGLSGNVLRLDDVLTLGGGSQANIALNSGTISDTTDGGTTTAALLVLTGLTAQTQTIA